ncbi:MAG: hypothetical protein M3373_09595 [Gemmatimonadota bacterium]|nr:hypothetical protein [Gemmatimonadota bacterium]
MTAESSGDQPGLKAVATDTKDAEAEWADHFFRLFRGKTASGIREGHAIMLAQLELRIAQWPSEWGDDLLVLIYGDFDAPLGELDFADLGITIEPEKVTTSIIKSAMCVLKARVKIPEKSVKGLVDAAARIDTLLGVFAVLDWGNSGSGWWSHVTHGGMHGVMPRLECDG